MGIYSIIDRRAEGALKQVSSYFHEEAEQTTAFTLPIRGVRNITTSYFLQNKWMGRIYIYQWHVEIEGNEHTNGIVELKHMWKGEAHFQSKQFSQLCNMLQQHPKWNDIVKVIDFEKLHLSYCRDTKVWNITVWPNFGDYIWMLIPPVRYYRKPSKEEQRTMIDLVKMIADVVKKYGGEE